jgi:NADH-quinone oxidoreductase subunit G
VIAVETVMTDTVREHADVVFPGEAYAEKEGTLVHPDGRVQRLRPAIGRPRARNLRESGSPAGVRAGWQVIADVARGAGLDVRVLSGAMASARLFATVPFYAGLTLDELAGRGVRWPVTEAGQAWGSEWSAATLSVPPAAGTPNGRLRLGTFRSLWASKEVDASPSLHFLRVRQVAELSPEDAERFGIREGDRVEVGTQDAAVQATVRLRAAIPSGSVFLAEGTEEDPANALTDALVEVRRTGGPVTDGASAVPVQVVPAAEGLAEAPASAPMDIPPTAGGGTATGGGSEG